MKSFTLSPTLWQRRASCAAEHCSRTYSVLSTSLIEGDLINRLIRTMCGDAPQTQIISFPLAFHFKLNWMSLRHCAAHWHSIRKHNRRHASLLASFSLSFRSFWPRPHLVGIVQCACGFALNAQGARLISFGVSNVADNANDWLIKLMTTNHQTDSYDDWRQARR